MSPTGEVMVGRGAELDSLRRMLPLEGQPRARFAAVSGEPGIGKTMLLAQLAELAEEAGQLLLQGRAAEFEREEPFGPLVDALDDYLGSLQPRLLEPLGADRLGELARAFPSLAELGAEPSVLDAERYRLYRALRSLLELLAVRAPLVLALDDVHWADGASLELISYLLRRPPAAPVLVVLCFRPAQIEPRLASQLSLATASQAAALIELEPLSKEETREMLASRVSGDTFERVYGLSGGNPFFAEQLARSASAGPPEQNPTLHEGGIPNAVVATIDRERGWLSDAARLLLDGAAVAGDPFDIDSAAVAAAIPADHASRALDELLDSDLVRTTAVPTRFRFRHPIVRRAVYESAGRGWRLDAHARLVAALREHGDDSSSELVRHLEASARRGDEEAIALLDKAARKAMPRAPSVAARRFEAALRLVPDVAEHAPRRLELLIPLATSLGAAGDLERSREALLAALDLLPVHDPARVSLVAFCGAVEHLLGRHGEAHARLRGALEALPGRRSPEGAALMVELAADAVQMSDYERAIPWALEAQRTAGELSEPATHVTATALAAYGHWSLGRADAGRALAEHADALVDRLDDAQLAARLDVFYYLALAELFTWNCAAALSRAERGLRLSRRTGQGYVLVQLMVARAMALLGLGRVADAGEAATAVSEAAQVSGTEAALLWASWASAWVSRATDLRTAVQLGEETYRLATRHGSPAQAGGAGWVLGAALVEAGDAARARAVLLESCGGEELPHIVPGLRCLGYEVLTHAALALDRRAEAADWAARAGATAGVLGLGVASAQAGRAAAAVLLAEGAAGQAAGQALAAAEAALRQDAPIEAARARILAGRALAAAGERERARAELEAARAELERSGATVFADEARRELRRLGQRVGRSGRRGAGTGVASLSGRELEVARLVADGRTNKEIAAALFLSEKTVEKHLSRVFAKLDAPRRGAVAARLAGDGDQPG